jgi:hypothetical protein
MPPAEASVVTTGVDACRLVCIAVDTAGEKKPPRKGAGAASTRNSH